MADKSELEILMEKHTQAAYSRGHEDGVRDALEAMDRVLRGTYIDTISRDSASGIVVSVIAPGRQRVRFVPVFGAYLHEAMPEFDRITGPACEVIPAAVRHAMGRKAD